MGITIEIAEKHLEQWLEADEKVAAGQSYTMGSRSLTRADAKEISNKIDYWASKVAELENVQKRGGRNKMSRFVPRDL